MATLPPRGRPPAPPAPAPRGRPVPVAPAQLPRAGTPRTQQTPRTLQTPTSMRPARPGAIPEGPAKPTPNSRLPKGLSPKQLLTMGRRFWGRNSQWVKLQRPVFDRDKTQPASLKVVTYSSHFNNGVRKKPREITRYLTSVQSLDDVGVPLSKARRVKVSCQCKSHKYGCEFKLHRLGAADLLHSNGHAPVTYMPNTPAVCKHVYKTILEVLRRGM